MASTTAANAVVTPRLSHAGVTSAVCRVTGTSDGTFSVTHLLMIKIPNRTTVLDGYINIETATSFSFQASVLINNVTVSASLSAGGAVTRFNAGIPVKISLSDDAANQYVWAELNITAVTSGTAAHTLDLVVFYAPIGAAEFGT